MGDPQTSVSGSGYFFNRNHFAPLVGSAFEAGAMGQFRFAALRASRSRNRRQKIMGTPFIPSRSGVSFYWIWHNSSSFFNQ
jgi:hypothetical protein